MRTELENLIAREEIRETVYRYCKAIDARDWDGVTACFSPDAQINHGSFSGSFDEFIGFLSRVLGQMTATLHSVGGIIVTFDGEEAQTNAPFSSFHRIPGSVEKVGPVVTGGVDTDWIVAGRYCDTLRKFEDGWRIVKRQAYTDWARVEPKP